MGRGSAFHIPRLPSIRAPETLARIIADDPIDAQVDHSSDFTGFVDRPDKDLDPISMSVLHHEIASQPPRQRQIVGSCTQGFTNIVRAPCLNQRRPPKFRGQIMDTQDSLEFKTLENAACSHSCLPNLLNHPAAAALQEAALLEFDQEVHAGRTYLIKNLP